MDNLNYSVLNIIYGPPYPGWVLIVAPLLCFVLYAVFDGLADGYIFKWMRTQNGSAQSALAGNAMDYNAKWHRFQAAQQVLIIGAITFLSGQWPLLLAGAGLFWMIHDGIVNRVGLNRSFFYVGRTAWTDRQFQKLPHPEVFLFVAKAASIIFGSLLFLL